MSILGTERKTHLGVYQFLKFNSEDDHFCFRQGIAFRPRFMSWELCGCICRKLFPVQGSNHSREKRKLAITFRRKCLPRKGPFSLVAITAVYAAYYFPSEDLVAVEGGGSEWLPSLGRTSSQRAREEAFS
jgi:hypothetical protein